MLSPNFVNMYHCYNLSWVVLIDFTSGTHCHCSVLVHMRCRCVDPSLLRPVRLPSCQACLINTTWQRSLLTSLCKASVILRYPPVLLTTQSSLATRLPDFSISMIVALLFYYRARRSLILIFFSLDSIEQNKNPWA